jgi:anti-anti-sigma factor
MSVQEWSDRVLLVEARDDPAFTDDIDSALETLEARAPRDVVVNLAEVSFINSSNIARLIELHKVVVADQERKLILCAMANHILRVFQVAGLDKLFEFADDATSALASVQKNR